MAIESVAAEMINVVVANFGYEIAAAFVMGQFFIR